MHTGGVKYDLPPADLDKVVAKTEGALLLKRCAARVSCDRQGSCACALPQTRAHRKGLKLSAGRFCVQGWNLPDKSLPAPGWGVACFTCGWVAASCPSNGGAGHRKLRLPQFKCAANAARCEDLAACTAIAHHVAPPIQTAIHGVRQASSKRAGSGQTLIRPAVWADPHQTFAYKINVCVPTR